jgi:hypothetical protein
VVGVSLWELRCIEGIGRTEALLWIQRRGIFVRDAGREETFCGIEGVAVELGFGWWGCLFYASRKVEVAILGCEV